MKAIVRLMTVPKPVRDLAWVLEALRAAIQLELSTIPPYLFAAWSVDPDGDPSGGAGVIKRIAQQEMLHLGIACNLLTALGGTVDLEAASRPYPLTLPTHVHEGLEVALAPLSRELLLGTFMVIEEPSANLVDDPDFTPSGTMLIGNFYDDVIDAIAANSPVFTTTHQVSMKGMFEGVTSSFVVASVDDARAAVDLIKRQGEGSAAGPFEGPENPDELAHFYQFGELAHGRRLTRTAPFSYTGDALGEPVVRPVQPASPDLASGAAFDRAYSDLLRALGAAWQGAGPGPASQLGAMFALDTLAETVIADGAGPAFRVIPPTATTPNGTTPTATTTTTGLAQIKTLLDGAVGGGDFGAHGPFWRGLSRDELVSHSVFGQQLLQAGDGAGSMLVRALRGLTPFGSDVGTLGATFRRMPAGRPALAAEDVDVIERWIDAGCPDVTSPGTATPAVSASTGAFRPDPSVHVDYFRDLDNWSMFHATPVVSAAISTVFPLFGPWSAFAKDAGAETAWDTATAAPGTRAALDTLSTRQEETVEAHYGTPVPLLTVLDAFERFGADQLPTDPLRPAAPRHAMNGAIMWFIHSAFAEACVRARIAPDFWTFMQRPILCGLLNDGVFRGRFPVDGFEPTDEGRLAIFSHAQSVSDTDLSAEIRSRYVASGL